MRTLSIFAVVVFVSSLATPTWAGMEEDCVQGRDPDLQISGCTAMIRSGQYSDRNLGVAHTNRGNAYNALGNPARAIENYDRALRLNPGYALAYNNRGIAYTSLGEYARAQDRPPLGIGSPAGHRATIRSYEAPRLRSGTTTLISSTDSAISRRLASGSGTCRSLGPADPGNAVPHSCAARGDCRSRIARCSKCTSSISR